MEAASAMAAGVYDVDPLIETILLPVADGGEGTMRNLIAATNGKEVSQLVQDPLGRKISASFGVLGDGETCVIEMAEASGLLLLDETERDPRITSTYGTGELIRLALDEGFRKFIVGLGGSATNDAGVGMLSALGMTFLDKYGEPLHGGGSSLINVEKIDDSGFDQRIAGSSFHIASDVQNPLVGEHGASTVFGAQKGATLKMVVELDEALHHFADVVERQTGISLHNQAGAGAAGGLGGAFLAFFPSEMKRGIEVILDAISFQVHLEKADLVLTGEGKTDAQTLSGKAPIGIAKAAEKCNKPVILIAGLLEEAADLQHIFTEVHAVVNDTISKATAIKNAEKLLREKTKIVLENYLHRNK